MKTKNIIQRLCLFLFALVLALPAVATNYDREGYEIFRSRKTVEQVGKNKRVYELRQGPVKIWFDDGKTTSGTGSSAIYELKKGSRIQVLADDGYAIRWIILRDTEGGKRYSDPEGIKRIDRVSSGYSYYFERNAISNSHISGGNQNQLNDDDNNIVVQQYDATNKIVVIYTHNNSKWDQFKVRDIIVGYVRKPKVRYTREQYNIYSTLESFDPYLKRDGHTGDVKWVLDNPDIADISGNGYVRPKRPGMGTLTATFSADRACAKVQCSTTINVQRDRVNFTAKDLPNMLFDKYDFRSHIKTSTASKKEFRWDNPQLSITSSNSSILSCDNGTLKPGGTAGEATITLRQKQNDLYEAATFSHTFIVMRKDQDGTVLIKDANEWKLFCKLVNDKGMTNLNARLEADIDLEWEIAMVGNDYAGTFDGQNHTLKFIWYVESDSYIAPFKKVSGATIRNLRTEGEIHSSTHYLSGLITEAYGKTTITGCVSNVDIKSSYTGDGCAAAGMISYIGSSANVTITDCIVKGKITATMNNGKKGMGGFVYSQNGTCTLTNCLYIGKNNATDNSYTFADNATIKNCYFLDACGSKQGEQVTADQLKSGEVTHKLQNGRSNMVWGQTLSKDNDPQLTTNAKKRVYKVTFTYTYSDQVKAIRYANSGKTITLPTVQEILGTDYNPQHYYTMTFEDGFSASTTIGSDRTVRIKLNDREYYEIASKEDWKAFCDIVNGGQNAVDAKMTKDVNLGGDIAMIGSRKNYSGIFDGQGHTLTVNWNVGNKSYIAPFYIVEKATIKNLRTEGQITSNEKFLSGLVGNVYGTTTISGCVSAVNITSSYDNGGCNAAGLICIVKLGANVTIDDCVVKGNITATTDKGKEKMAGFVSGQEGTCTLNNCLYLGSGNGDTFSRTFVDDAYHGVTTTLNNCYFLNACGTAQGTQITAEQLKNGYVAYKLQNSRNTQFWGQNLDTDNEPQLTADAAKHVYEVKFTYNNKVAATRYANSGKAIAGGMPTLTAKDLLGTGYNPHHYYTIAFAGGFNGSTTVDADRTVTVTLTEKDCYEIASKEDWKEFCDLVNGGQNAVDAKMTADVDLGGDIKTISGVHKYSGTFDGQGHTLTVNWKDDYASLKAPFRYVDGATIKNLRTKGKIQGNYGLAGLIYSVYGNTTVSGCVSEMDIKGAHDLAGMIYRVNTNAKVTMTDCVVKGDLTATTEDGKKQMVGFIYDIYGGYTLTNCLYIGTNNATGGSTFGWTPNITNCYYLNPCGEAQGEKITEEQLKNGYVAYKLQNGRNTQFWGQNLDTDNEPQLTADAAKHVYEVKFTYNNKVAATRYANQGGNVKLPTAKELLGADYDAQKSYKLAFENGFSETTAINGDITVNVTVSVVTGIDGVTADKADTNTPVYDLQGRYLGISLDHLPRGIYIVGGKKVIKK